MTTNLNVTMQSPSTFQNFQVGGKKYSSDDKRMIRDVDANDAPALEHMGCVVVSRQ